MSEVLSSFIFTVLFIAVLVGGYLLVKAFPIIGIIGFCIFLFCLLWFAFWFMIVA
nr:MAG TPA: hypothetical protein [Caudoviricetes sp.]